MKRSYIALGLPVTLVLGFYFGRLSSSAEIKALESKQESAQSAKRRSAERPAAEAAKSFEARFRREIQTSTADKLAPLVFRAMEIGDPILRRQFLYDLFQRMDVGNFREMADEMDRVSLETGRDNYVEWLLVHTRAGQVAGATAMERWKADGKIAEPAWRTMWGWSSTDPDAAMKWLEQADGISPADRSKLLSAITSGALIKDREKAMNMLAGLSEEDRIRCVGQFTFDIIQQSGKEGAIGWLKSVVNTDKESAYAKRVSDQVFDKLVYSGANQSNVVSIVADIEQLSAVIPMDEGRIVRAMGQIRDRRAVGGIELMDQVLKSPTLKDLPFSDRTWNSSVQYAIQKDRNAVGDWLTKNPQSPMFERVSAAYGAQ